MTVISDADEASALSALDSPETIAERDPSSFHGLIEGLPQQARDAWALAQAWPLPAGFGTPSRVVLLGLGGSAIGADIVTTLARLRSTIPVEVVRQYDAPRLDDRALVIGCSFSGNTEETIAAFDGTLGQPGMRLAFTTGGRLAREARERATPLLTYAWDGPPRTSLGYGLFTMLGLLARLDVIDMDDVEAASAFAAIADATDRYGLHAPMNEAKRLAIAVGGRLPVIIAPDFLEVAARRFAAEVNENAKRWAFSAGIPEFNHNALQALLGPDGTPTTLAPIILDAPSVHPRNRLRVRETARMMTETGATPYVVTIEGNTPLETIVRATTLASWTSYYLAMLHGIDPMPVDALDTFKDRMARG